jgi:hypothetical protein
MSWHIIRFVKRDKKNKMLKKEAIAELAVILTEWEVNHATITQSM